MSRLEVDVKSIQELIRSRALNAQKTLTKLEIRAEKLIKGLVKKGQLERFVRDVQETVNASPWVKTLKKTTVYNKALEAKDEFEKRVADAQERVFKILNVPTRQELDELNRKINTLDKLLQKNKKASSSDPVQKK